MKAIIIEDNLLVADNLKTVLKRHEVEVLNIYDTAEEAIEKFSNKADLYFIDIRLSGKKTGIDVAKFLAKAKIPFVFVTANNEISTVKSAAQTNPFGYITKPYKESDIVALLEMFKLNHSKVIEVKTNLGKKRIKLVDVLYFEADGSYTKTVLLNEVFKERATLSEVESRHGSLFTRVHRSYLVNKHKIEHYNSNELYINGNAIPIGRNFKESYLDDL
jgi:DNA-binding LytR/AlgR family response regulator